MKYLGYIVAGVVALFVLTIFFGSWYTIDERERGVVLRNGSFVGVAEPGLGFKLPLIDNVVEFSVENHIAVWDPVPAYSRDQQPADIRLSVNYQLAGDKMEEIYSLYGSTDAVVNRIVQPRVFEHLKNVFGQFNAVTAIQERGRLNSQVEEAIRKAVEGPVIIHGVQIENIDFSAAYEQSIEERMLAEVEVQRLRQNAEREKVQAEIVVTQANAQANAVRAEAEADADAILLRGTAEAKAIKLRGDALRDNPDLIALTQAEKWNGVLPTTMLPGGAVPMLNLSASTP